MIELFCLSGITRKLKWCRSRGVLIWFLIQIFKIINDINSRNVSPICSKNDWTLQIVIQNKTICKHYLSFSKPLP